MARPTDRRVVIVTGAGGRLGRRMVEAFAHEGATVAAVDRRVAGAPEAGVARAADLTDEAAVSDLFAELARELGPPDLLVHTVGMWDGRSLLETSLSDWRRVLDVNLTSAFLCFREAARHMQERGGQIIGIASGQGADRGRAEQAAYSAAKAGVMRLVEAVAEEFAATPIRAHAIAPSTILFDDDDGEGVAVDDVVALCRYLAGAAGGALSGATLRAYGSAR